jgi:hypothetical protein
MDDDNIRIGIFKQLEQIASTLIQIIVWKDALKIVKVWSDYRPNLDKTACQNVVALLEIFGFESFRFSMATNHIELFEDHQSLRVPKQILCEESLYCLRNIRKYEQSSGSVDSFFQSQTSNSMTHEIYSHFRFNYLFETLVDRRLIFYHFIWHLYRFDRYPSFEQHADQDQRWVLALAEFLWLCLESFLCRNIEKYSPSVQIKPQQLYVKAVAHVQKLLSRPETLYRFLSSKLQSNI